MKIRTEFPRPTREVENFWITLADGTRLAGRMWLPIDAEEQPVPAILTYKPYRKSDFFLPLNSQILPYLAGHGYAAAWVDIRGSGESDGILTDEYSELELSDGVEVIAWLAAQSWCTGAVGMWGTSWGGCNTLQVAARRPPELKAVISIGSMVDLYDEDVYYWGGCFLTAHLIWSTTCQILMALPPRPSIFGKGWRENWLARLENLAGIVETKLSHQRRDAYWRRASICEDYAAIACPVYMIGGWADGYVNAVPRFVENFRGVRKGLIGPWAHGMPPGVAPGPQIGFLQETLRWWDHWLKGIENGIMAEPALRAWMQESVEPKVFYDERPGRWVAEAGWPPRNEYRAYVLNPGSLCEETATETPLQHRGLQHLGSAAGTWNSGGNPDLPLDQREDDALSLIFDSDPVEQPLEILGFPEVNLEIAADKPNAFVVARLCDVAADGASTLISYGMLNLTHRESHEHLTPVEPGKRYSVSLLLRATGYRVPVGHRLRLALSSTYWPLVWPSPEVATLTIFAGAASGLRLPIRQDNPDDALLAPFGEAETSPAVALTWSFPGTYTRTAARDLIGGKDELAIRTGGRWRLDGTSIESGFNDRFLASITEGNPLSAQVRCEKSIDLAEDGWQIHLDLKSVVTSDLTSFRVTMGLDAYEGDVRAYTRSWNLVIPRDLV